LTSRPSLDVAVVGGGIGGLTTAVALVRKGIDVTVYEQAPELLPVGASLALGPNATRLLGALGLMEPVRRVGSAADAVELLRWSDGTVLLHTELGPPAEAHFGAPALDFHRADLHRVLIEALTEGTIRLGTQLTGVEQRRIRSRRAGSQPSKYASSSSVVASAVHDSSAQSACWTAVFTASTFPAEIQYTTP